MSFRLIRHWSYSSWSLLKTCPAAYKFAKIDRLRQPENAAMERGTKIHSLAEHYVLGDITGGIPKDLQKLAREIKNLKAAKPIVEQFWGVNQDWVPMGRGSWVVMKMDAAILPTKKANILGIVDYKTGREYPGHESQGSLYAAIGFALYPKIDAAFSEFFYTDQGYVQSYDYSRAQLRYLVSYWKEEGERLMSTRKYLPTPSKDACRYCGFRSDKKLADGSPGPCSAFKTVEGGSSYGRW